MNSDALFWLVPAASIAALVFAWFFYQDMMKNSEGTDRMKEIAKYVREGAMAYLRQQYKVVIIVFVILTIIFAFLAYVFKIQNPWARDSVATLSIFIICQIFVDDVEILSRLLLIHFHQNPALIHP